MIINKHFLHQLISVLPANNILLVLGYCNGWVPQVLVWLRSRITLEECSLIGSLYYLGRGVGPMAGALLVDRVGRNALITTSAVLCFMPWLALLYFEAEAVVVQYAARLMLGLSCALQEVAASFYIGENCSSGLRGVFNCVLIVHYLVGSLLAFVLGTYCSYRTLNAVGAALAFVAVVSTRLLKEPANFLAMKGRVEEAKKNFLWLRDAGGADGVVDEIVEREFRELIEYVEDERKARQEKSIFNRLVGTPGAVKSLRIVIVVTTLFMMNGFAAIYSYLTIILRHSQILTPPELSMLFGVVVTIFTVVIDRFDRRTLFLSSSVLMILTASCAAVVFVVGRHKTFVDDDRVTLLTFTLLTLHVGVYMGVPFPLTSALRGEILPQNLKALGTGLTMTVASCGSFLSAQVFLAVSDSVGVEYNFYFYTGLGVASLLYVYLELPETRGKTLVHIQNEMSGSGSRNK